MSPLFALCCSCKDNISIENSFDEEKADITVMSYNMLFEHTVPNEPERQWTSRCSNIIETINSIKPDIIGSQELQSYQLADLVSGTGYSRIGCSLAGTTSDTDNNENENILYNKERIKCIESGNFWFNSSPTVPKPASGATYNRMCTWGRFKELSSGRTFYVFNSHFYVESQELRNLCSNVLLERAGSIAPTGSAVILTGDLNAQVSDDCVQTLIKAGYKDSRSMVANPIGPTGTYYNFEISSSPIYRLDHILVNGKVTVDEYEIIDSQMTTGKIESDHLPVFVHLKI